MKPELKQHFASLSIIDIFYRPYPRTRQSLELESFSQHQPVESVYCMGSLMPVETVAGPLITQAVVRNGPLHMATPIFIEYRCPRCAEHHEREALRTAHSTSKEGNTFEVLTYLELSHLDPRCELCIAEVEAHEAAISKVKAEISELHGKIQALEDHIHDEQALIDRVDEHPAALKCKTCDRRRYEEEQTARAALYDELEAQELDDFYEESE